VSEYLVIPHIRAKHINVLQGNVSVSPHSMTAMSLFVHAMERKCGDGRSTAFGVVQHDAWLDADDMGYGVYRPWQRRASMLIDGDDFSKDAKKNNRPQISLQPVITGNLEFSVVLRYEEDAPTQNRVERFLETARFQGGRIDGFGPVKAFDSEASAKGFLRTGKWIVDRHDLLEESDDVLDAMLKQCALKEREEFAEGEKKYPVLWSMATVGYALLTDPVFREDARLADAGPVPSAFAEAMTGLVGLYSVHDERMESIPFWESGFVEKDVYLVRGQTCMKKEI